MSRCVTSPTATSVRTDAQTNLETTFTPSLTTQPPTTSTLTTSDIVCETPAPVSGLPLGDEVCTTNVGTSVTVIPGGVQTEQVPVVLTNIVTNLNTVTLFGTSCAGPTPDPQPTPDNPPNNGNNSNNGNDNNNNGQQSQSAAPVLSTPPPETFTSATMSTDPLGNVQTWFTTVTRTPDAVTHTPGVDPTMGSSTPRSGSSNVGAIVGGALGGVVGLGLLLALIWFLLKRKKQWDGVFDGDYEDFMKGRKQVGENRMDLADDFDDGPAALEPKPYQYGLVGGSIPSPKGFSPPVPPSKPEAHSMSNVSARGPGHGREASLAPLTGGHGNGQGSWDGGHSPAPSITLPPMRNASSEGYFPPVPGPASRHPSPPPQRSTSSPFRPPGAAPPTPVLSFASRTPSPPLSAASTVASLPATATLARKSVGNTSMRSSIVDYPIHSGVLKVTNADIPKSPATPNMPTSARSSQGKYSSPLQLNLGADASLDPDAMFGSIGADAKRSSRQR